MQHSRPRFIVLLAVLHPRGTPSARFGGGRCTASGCPTAGSPQLLLPRTAQTGGRHTLAAGREAQAGCRPAGELLDVGGGTQRSEICPHPGPILLPSPLPLTFAPWCWWVVARIGLNCLNLALWAPGACTCACKAGPGRKLEGESEVLCRGGPQ